MLPKIVLLPPLGHKEAIGTWPSYSFNRHISHSRTLLDCHCVLQKNWILCNRVTTFFRNTIGPHVTHMWPNGISEESTFDTQRKLYIPGHNGWFPRFESNMYFAIKVNQNFLIQPLGHTQGPQGYQNIHKNILQINLMRYNHQINPNTAKK